ncbi:hypothetical protein LCGC14_2142880 [marine sediment metagenome]|uniref:Uncharacterized protein n=1 Tax=marine sediment metagenome TaxID=412755 RepID=A0A0F9DY44_9ZZZZ
MTSEEEIKALRKTVVELRNYIFEMLGENTMNATAILAVLQIVMLLQQMKEGKDLPDAIRKEALKKVVEGTDEEIEKLDEAMQKVSPNFLGSLLKGIGDFLGKLLGG